VFIVIVRGGNVLHLILTKYTHYKHADKTIAHGTGKHRGPDVICLYIKTVAMLYFVCLPGPAYTRLRTYVYSVFNTFSQKNIHIALGINIRKNVSSYFVYDNMG